MKRGTHLRLGENGNVSIETALAASVLFLLILAIFELGYVVFVQSVLDGAARDAARLVRTGQVQASGNPQAAFQTKLCAEMSALVGCGDLVFIVQSFGSSFATVNLALQRDQNGQLVVPPFAAGGATSIVAVQVIYQRPFFTSYISNLLGGASDSAFLESTVIFRNEPFS